MITLECPQRELHAVRTPTAEREIEAGYFEAARNRTIDRIKQPERERVLRHILDNCDPAVRMRLLSMPGMHWHFERMVEAEIGEHQAYFVGVERSWQVIELGLQYMPGRIKRRFNWSKPCGKSTAFASSKAAIVWCDIEDWFRISSLLPTDRKKEKQPFPAAEMWSRMPHQTAFWIDLFGPLMRIEMARTLRQLSALASTHVQRIPFAVTGMFGRDTFLIDGCEGVDGRAAAVCAELSHNGWAASVSDAWSYYGFNEARMVTVCGVMNRAAATAVEA